MVNKLVMMVLSVALLSSCSENKSSDRSVSEEERTGVSELQSNSGDMFLLIGTYTSDNGSKGIYVHKFKWKILLI
jgi:hypothetical protein